MADGMMKSPDKAPVAPIPRSQPLESFNLDAVLATGSDASSSADGGGSSARGGRPVNVGAPLVLPRRSNPKPWDIEFEVVDGERRPVMRRCLITNRDPPDDLGDWRGFPQLGDGETRMVYLRCSFPKKESVSDAPRAIYDIIVADPGNEADLPASDSALSTLYPLYLVGSGGKVVVDYRDAFVRTFNFYTDERSISRDDYPDFQQVLSLSHFYDAERDVTAASAKASPDCYVVLRAKLSDETRPRVCYIPLSELKKLVRGTSGGGGGGDDGEEDDDDWIDWVGNCVTSLNGAKGDLQLIIDKGFLELRKNGQLVANGLVGWVVEALNGITGNTAIIGGKGIRVTTEGNSVRITADAEKDSEDENPYPEEADACEHPDSSGGVLSGGGGGGGVSGGVSGGGGGGGDCCGGGQGTTESASGSPTGGVSGQSAPAGTTGPANGKPASSVPSGGTTSGSSGQQASSSSGLANYSTISKKTIGVNSSTHSSLTNSKTMNQSPFATNGNYKPIGSNATTPIYNNTHGQLTDSKKMNTSPWAAGKK